MIWFTDIIFDLDYFWVPDDYKPTLALFISFLVFFKDISKPSCLHPNSLSSLLPDTFHSPCIWVVSTSVTLKSSHTDTRASWLTSQVLFKPAPSLHFHCYQPNLSRQHLSSWLFCYSSTISTPHIPNGRNPFSWRFYYKSILSILCPCALSFAVLQPICSSASKSDYTFHEKDECAFQLVSIRCPANLSPVCFMSPSPGYQHTYTHAQA